MAQFMANSHQGLRSTYEQLMSERRVEFGIEGIAWYDVNADIIVTKAEAINYLNAQNRAVTLTQKNGWQGDRNVYDAYEVETSNTGYGE